MCEAVKLSTHVLGDDKSAKGAKYIVVPDDRLVRLRRIVLYAQHHHARRTFPCCRLLMAVVVVAFVLAIVVVVFSRVIFPPHTHPSTN